MLTSSGIDWKIIRKKSWQVGRKLVRSGCWLLWLDPALVKGPWHVPPLCGKTRAGRVEGGARDGEEGTGDEGDVVIWGCDDLRMKECERFKDSRIQSFKDSKILLAQISLCGPLRIFSEKSAVKSFTSQRKHEVAIPNAIGNARPPSPDHPRTCGRRIWWSNRTTVTKKTLYRLKQQTCRCNRCGKYRPVFPCSTPTAYYKHP